MQVARRCPTVVLLGLVACGDAGLQWEGPLGAPVDADIQASTPLIDVVVDATMPGRFLIDTGAPYTILDIDSFARPVGVYDVTLDAFGGTFRSYDVAAYDALPYTMGDDVIDGIVGGDLLRNFALTIDYQGARAWVAEDGDGAPPDDVVVARTATMALELRGGGAYSIPGRCDGGCGTIDAPATRVVVAAELDGESVRALVDTGASLTVVSEALLSSLGGTGRPRLDGVTVGTATGARSGYLTRIGRMRMGDSVTVSSAPALVVPGWSVFDQIASEVGGPVDVIVGGSALRHFVTTIDYPRRELVLATYADMSHIDPREYVRPGFALVRVGARWVVGDVYPGTDAAAKGIRSGEHVVRIGDAELADLGAAELAEVLAGYAVGQLVPVALERASAVETVEVRMEDLLPAYEGA